MDQTTRSITIHYILRYMWYVAKLIECRNLQTEFIKDINKNCDRLKAEVLRGEFENNDSYYVVSDDSLIQNMNVYICDQIGTFKKSSDVFNHFSKEITVI